MAGPTSRTGKPGESPEQIVVATEVGELGGELHFGRQSRSLVLFAHGSGSSRHSARNQYVATMLQRAGIGTLLFDLMTKLEEEEDRITRTLRFDIPFLTKRLVAATRWAQNEPRLRSLQLGYFGASTGGAAAVAAAAELGDELRAVVSRGGRPDLARTALRRVTCPTLFIVGGLDNQVLQLNQAAFAELQCRKDLRIIPGATHLFEEPGALEQVAKLAADWFKIHLESEPVSGVFQATPK